MGFEQNHAIDRRKIVRRRNVLSQQHAFRGYGTFRPSARSVALWKFLTGGLPVMAFGKYHEMIDSGVVLESAE